MDWPVLVWYGLGVPSIALFVGSWWLGHFAAAMTAGDSCPPKQLTWSRLRRCSVTLSGFPFFAPGVTHFTEFVLYRLGLRAMGSDSTFFVLVFLNGVFWGVVLVTLLRFLVS